MWPSVVLGVVVAASALNPTFDRANQEYLDGDFGEAVEIYEGLIAEGVEHPVVFFNLGNAYYQLDEMGPAIANYERVLLVDPAFSEAEDNLRRAVARSAGGMKAPLAPGWQQALLFWDDGMRPDQSQRLFLALNLGLWVVLIVRLLRPFPYSRILAGLFAVAVVLSGLSVWTKEYPPPIGVASEPIVPVRYGTDESEPIRFELQVGDRIMVEAYHEDWVRVRTIDGERGWAEKMDFSFVNPLSGVRTAKGSSN